MTLPLSGPGSATGSRVRPAWARTLSGRIADSQRASGSTQFPPRVSSVTVPLIPYRATATVATFVTWRMSG